MSGDTAREANITELKDLRKQNDSLKHYRMVVRFGQNIEEKVVKATDIISNLGKAYLQIETAHKRRITSSVFPKGLIFDNWKVRTRQINKVIA